MKKVTCLVITLATLTGTLAGCGGSGGAPAVTTTVSGVVADGYLRGAEVFLDMNGNYQWDAGEPKTLSGQGGTYNLNISPELIEKHPIVVRAIAGQTIDEDNPSAPIANTYVMSAPAAHNGFISPMSTLIHQKLTGNPGMTMTDAMIQLRNQLNLPVGVDMLGNYIAGGQSGPNSTSYQTMYQVATQMAGLMSQQAPLVMTGNGVNMNRYQAMMGQINLNMPQIVQNTANGLNINSPVMTNFCNQMTSLLQNTATGTGFRNYSTMFRNYTSHAVFWNYSGGSWRPGGMMGMNWGMMGMR